MKKSEIKNLIRNLIKEQNRGSAPSMPLDLPKGGRASSRRYDGGGNELRGDACACTPGICDGIVNVGLGLMDFIYANCSSSGLGMGNMSQNCEGLQQLFDLWNNNLGGSSGNTNC